MDVLYEACKISCERWVNNIEKDISDEHKFSRKHLYKMHKICSKIKYYHISKRLIIPLVAALIAMLTATSVFAIVKNKDFLIEKFNTFSIYSVNNISDSEELSEIEIDYIPNGFIQKAETSTSFSHRVQYSKENMYFNIQKVKYGVDINFDTEDFTHEELEIDGNKYILYSSNQNTHGLIWNNGQYEYLVFGNIEKDEIINIALSTN